MIAASILVLAAVLYFRLRRLTLTIAAFGTVIERALNRVAARNGEPPLMTEEDVEKFM